MWGEGGCFISMSSVYAIAPHLMCPPLSGGDRQTPEPMAGD